MKKITILLLSISWISAHSAAIRELTIAEPTRVEECSKIKHEYLSRTIGKGQYLQKLTKCSENGNILCTFDLATLYLREKNYSTATPLLLKLSVYNSNSNDNFSSKIRTSSNYALGKNYMLGLGVLQDFDKAIQYFKIGAKNGDKDSIILVSQLFFNKATLSSEKKDFDDSFMKGYAYMKIAQSLPGKIKIRGNDGKIVNPIKSITQMQELDYFKPYLKEANALAKKICPAIQGCRQ